MGDLLYGINPVHEALSGEGRRLLELLVDGTGQNRRVEKLVVAARKQGVAVRQCERRELDRLFGHGHHQGVALRLEPFGFTTLEELLNCCRESDRPPFLLILDGVTDPHNFGAILRSAEVAGCHGVIVGKDRACTVTATVEKTAAGALSHLRLCQVVNLSRTLEDLKKQGIWCYGLAGEQEASGLYDVDLCDPVALVVGSEGQGLRPNVRRHCDGLLSIPVIGRISSLNASVAAGVALFEVVRQRREGKA